MTKLIQFSFLFTLLSFCSCGNDDDGPEPVDNFVGTWNISSVSCDDGTISLDGGASTAGTFTQFGKDIAYQIDFLEDGTFISTGDITFDVTLFFLGNEIKRDEERNDWLGSGTWIRSEGSLVTDTDNDQDVTSSEIIAEEVNKIELKSVIVEQLTLLGFETTNTCTLFYTLER